MASRIRAWMIMRSLTVSDSHSVVVVIFWVERSAMKLTEAHAALLAIVSVCGVTHSGESSLPCAYTR